MTSARRFLILLLVPLLIAATSYLPHRRKAFRTTAASFSPTDISGLLYWYAADQEELSGYSDGDRVTLWTDYSGGNRNATNLVGSVASPFFTNNVVNGKPALSFAATATETNWLQTVVAGSSRDKTIFVVKNDRTPFAQSIYLSLAGGGVYVAANGGGGSGQAMWPWSGGWLGFGVTTVPGEWKMFAFTFQTNLSTLYTNSVYAKTNSWPHPAFSGVAMISGEPNNNHQNAYNGEIAEIIVYDSVLSTADRQNVETFLNSKYAIY